MGISHQTKKPSSRRPGTCKATTHTPRRSHVAQNRATRTVHIRPLPARNTPSRRQHALTAQTRTVHTDLTQANRASSPAAGCCPARRREQHAAHGDHSGCTVYCYFCYCCYCCCLTLLSFSLLLLLSPPPNAPPSASFFSLSSNITLLPVSSPSRSSTSCLDELSCVYSGVNLTSAVSPYCPVPPCLIYDDSFPLFYISSPDLTAPDQLTSCCHGASPTSTCPFSSSVASDSILPPHHPILCRPWPSSRSLSSLLLCPPSFGGPVLSYTSTLEHIPTRPRTLLRQQSLQQPLIQPPGPGLGHHPTTSQSLGQLHTAPGQPGGGGGGSGSGEDGGAGTRGGPRGVRGSPSGAGASRCRGAGAAGRSRANPGSWDYTMDQMRSRGMDVKSFL